MYVYIYTCVSIYIYTIQGAFHPFLVSFLPMVQSFEDPNCTWNLGQLAQQRTVGFQGRLLLLHLAPLDWKWDCEDLRKRHMHEASDRKTFFSSARWQFVRCCKKAIDFRIWIFLQETPIFKIAGLWILLQMYGKSSVFSIYFAGSFKFTGRHSEFERRGKIRGWQSAFFVSFNHVVSVANVKNPICFPWFLLLASGNLKSLQKSKGWESAMFSF